MARTPKASRSLEELDATRWPPAPAGATALVARCHALRKVPIGLLKAGDLRILIGQVIGTEHLLPLALDLLSEDALIEGDHYPGDLLRAAMSTDSAFWSRHQDEKTRLASIAARANSELTVTEDARRANRQLVKDIEAFIGHADA